MRGLCQLMVFGVLLAGLTQAASQAAPDHPMFPEGVSHDDTFLMVMKERPLWTANAAKGFKSRLRLYLYGPNQLKLAIRIDEDEAGEFSGRFVAAKSKREGVPRLSRVWVFSVSRVEMRKLHARMSTAGMWVNPRRGWKSADTTEGLCVQGTEMLFEHVNASGYFAESANAQCTAPSELLKIAESLIDLAGASYSKKILY